MAKRGRPQKPYETTWGEIVPGLYRCTDGRWRITKTGQKFTERDERRAVARFRSMFEPEKVGVPVAFNPTSAPDFDLSKDGSFYQDVPDDLLDAHRWRLSDGPGDPDLVAAFELGNVIVKAEDFWPWLREQIIEQPGYYATMTGIPELARLSQLPIPKPAIKIASLIATYEKQNPSTPVAKRRAINTFRKLALFANAEMLDDLTQEKLSAWRQSIESSKTIKSASTKAGMYGQVKAVISFGLKCGLDHVQLRAALDRCSVLWTAEPLPPVQPQPISREDFHALLAASDQVWQAWLLLALNLCMTAEDLCELRWNDFDMDKGTYAAIRVKTRRDRIPRAGVLWVETVEAMNALPKRSEYVFTSSHGTRYNKNSRVNLFAKLRDRAALPNSVKMNHIRDGAYTAACHDCPDERWARVLAGHRAAGLQDNYVLRNPEAVRPACEAVYAEYGPFKLLPSKIDDQSGCH